MEVVARPSFGKSEQEWLTRLRQARAHSSGPPEFTLVFPGSEFSTREVARHVAGVCAATARIRFCLRSAIIVPELDQSWFHVFLVPDEGFGAIIRLHDRLHVGPLAGCMRPEIPYIPHLTVASIKGFDEARRAKAALNAHELKITGSIEEVEVRERESVGARCVAKAALARHGLFG